MWTTLVLTRSEQLESCKKKIEFKNLVVNNEKLVGKNINTVENAFDKYILEDSILGFLDFFKIKKFIFEVSKNLD